LERVGIIGVGRIGGSLAARLAASGDFELTVSDAYEEQARRFSQEHQRVRFASDNLEVARSSDVIVVAVKPWDVAMVLEGIAGEVGGKAVVSVAAGVQISAIVGRLSEGAAVLRVMPNVCAAVGRGSAVVAANGAGDVGDVMELPERLFDAATALHGSGPAYVALFADSLVQAGVRAGIPREAARRLVNGTIEGTAVLLKDRAAHQIRDEVMTPGGTTAAALVAMEKAGFVGAIHDGVEAATEQSRRLAG
jgi:pyrroline-5-carboxylate reductase